VRILCAKLARTMCQLGASVIGEKVSVSKLFGAFFATLFGVDQTPLLMEMLSSFESIHRDQLKVASQVHCPSTWGLGLQPLYRALKSFGKIIKSIFILRYIDEVELRQAIERQLNKIEHAHRFARAVSVGNPREFIEASSENVVRVSLSGGVFINQISYRWSLLAMVTTNSIHIAHAEPNGV
jgi:hypothetical protein